jgi:hypothetical protein
MEWLLIALINLIKWLDHQLQKPLFKVVPDLERLLRDPAGTLAEGPILIGSRKSYATATALGLFVAFVLGCGSVVWIIEKPAVKPPARVKALLGLSILGLPVASVLLMLRLLRGGTMTLTPDGVELAYRGTVVHCPWALFNALGQPFLPGPRRFLLPVAPPAVPFVEARRQDMVFARGAHVQTPQLWFPSANEAELKALYEVHGKELGGLLLALGYLLGSELPDATPLTLDPLPAKEAPVVSPVTRKKDGWVTVRLTRLAFPSVCCDCESPTTTMHRFRGNAAFGDDHVLVEVPVCRMCQAANRRIWHRAVAWGAALGFGGPLALGFVSSVLLRRPPIFVVCLFLALLGAVLGIWIGYSIGRRRAQPVRLKHYSPRKGTVSIRFRRVDYVRHLFKAMQVREEEVAG